MNPSDENDQSLAMKLERMKMAARRSRPSTPGMVHANTPLSARGIIKSPVIQSSPIKELKFAEPKFDATDIERELLTRGVAPTFDPENRPAPKPAKQPLMLSDRRAFLMLPAPKDYGMIQCYIERERTTLNKLYPKYYLYHEKTNTFLLASRKRVKNKTSNYLLSLDKDDLKRGSGSYFGKLRANFWGTEFIIYDRGENSKISMENNRDVRNQLGCILYDVNVFGYKGPRKMTVIIPNIQKDGKFVAFPEESENENMIHLYKNNMLNNVQIFKNTQPQWNQKLQAFVLNFEGRVTKPSVKNFQISDEKDNIILQFGKVDENRFTLDFQYPLSPIQAFCIALSAFDKKLACE